MRVHCSVHVEQFGTIRNTLERLEQEFQILLQPDSEFRLEFQTVAPTVAPGAVAPAVAPGTVGAACRRLHSNTNVVLLVALQRRGKAAPACIPPAMSHAMGLLDSSDKQV